MASYRYIEEGAAACLNAIKGEVLTLCEMRGYESPLHSTLVSSWMDRETLECMHSCIEEAFPVFRSFYKRKAELLGHRAGLPIYDLYAPLGKSERRFTYDEARDFIVECFGTFGSALADFARRAFDERWIDAEPRPGKMDNPFCAPAWPRGTSRILSNFTGTFSDVLDLAHELGHAYHNWCLRHESILNVWFPIPIAESASVFCENIVMDAACSGASRDELVYLLDKAIVDASDVTVDVYARFLFEDRLFERRKDHPLSVAELKDLACEAQLEAYGEGLDPEALNPYLWVIKPHYYSAALSYYNFPYAFGLLFTQGLYADYLERGRAFVEEYDRMLSVTGKRRVADVAAAMGIDVRSPAFWRTSLALVTGKIESFLEHTG